MKRRRIPEPDRAARRRRRRRRSIGGWLALAFEMARAWL